MLLAVLVPSVAICKKADPYLALSVHPCVTVSLYEWTLIPKAAVEDGVVPGEWGVLCLLSARFAWYCLCCGALSTRPWPGTPLARLAHSWHPGTPLAHPVAHSWHTLAQPWRSPGTPLAYPPLADPWHTPATLLAPPPCAPLTHGPLTHPAALFPLWCRGVRRHGEGRHHWTL